MMLITGLTVCFELLVVAVWGIANTSTIPDVMLVTNAPSRYPSSSRCGFSNQHHRHGRQQRRVQRRGKREDEDLAHVTTVRLRSRSGNHPKQVTVLRLARPTSSLDAGDAAAPEPENRRCDLRRRTRPPRQVATALAAVGVPGGGDQEVPRRPWPQPRSSDGVLGVLLGVLLLLVFVAVLGFIFHGDPSFQRDVRNSVLREMPVIGPQIGVSVGSLTGNASRSRSGPPSPCGPVSTSRCR